MVGSRVIHQDFTRWQKRLGEAEKVFQKRMVKVGQDLGEFAVRQYEGVTRTWDHPVDFKWSVRMQGAIMTVDAGTDDPIFNMLDRGTRAHRITSTGPCPLRFRSGFSPKSRPGSLAARRGRSFGPIVYAHSVQHPGTVARLWTEEVVKVVQPEAIKEMDRDISLWAADYF